MEMTPEVINISTELAKLIGKKSVEAIFDKVKAVKQKGSKDEIINNLEEIINELISDKNQLIQISQAYEERLITQKITDVEIAYITTSIIPLLEKLLSESDSGDTSKMQSGLEMMKSFLSQETFNILQILGFNFMSAIGEPLTNLIAALIKSKIPANVNQMAEFQILNEQKELEFLKVFQNDEAYERLLQFYNK